MLSECDNTYALIARCVNGDIAAFDLLMRDYESKIFNYVYKMLGHREEAKETTQDIFFKIYTHLQQFRGESSFSTWLFNIVVNTCKNKLEYKNVRDKYSIEKNINLEKNSNIVNCLENIASNAKSPEHLCEMRELQQLIKSAIEELPEHYKTVIVLRDISGFSYAEIARILQCPVGTVKANIARGRLLLREKLDSVGDIYEL